MILNAETLTNSCQKQYQRILKSFVNLSSLEKFLIFFLCFIVIMIAIDSFVNNIYEIFDKQTKELDTVELHRKVIPSTLSEYIKLNNQKDEIEGDYDSLHKKGDLLTELESLLKNKNSVQRGFNITPLQNGQKLEKFAGNYEQLAFSLSFTISDYRQLQEILQELDTEMMIRSIDLTRYPRNMNVKIDVVGLHKISGER